VAKATRFKDETSGGRFYRVGEALLPSVTNILGSIAKPALVGWAAKTEREMCLQAACDLWDEVPVGVKKMERMAYRATLEARIGKQKAHAKELAKAGEIGNQVHGLIEWNLKREMGKPVGEQPRISDAAQWAFMAWEDWRKQANLRPIDIEETVWSKQHGYAGTMDLLGELDLPDVGRVVAVLDWKSGKAIYPEALLQNAAYVNALIEMGDAPPPLHGVVVRLPKVETDPAFEVKHIPANEQPGLLTAFLATLNLWRWMQAQQEGAA
jgi:hypothetical protein